MAGNKQRRKPQPAIKALEHGASLLNNKNLLSLWATSSALSVLDLYTPLESSLSVFPSLNHAKLRMFNQLILHSRSSYEKAGILDYRTLASTLNDALDLTYDPDSLSNLNQASDLQKKTELHRLFSLMANTQIAEQEFLIPQRLGRMIAMMEVIPDRRASSLNAEALRVVNVVRSKLSGILGASIKELAKVFVAIHLYYQQIYRRLEASFPPKSWLARLNDAERKIHILSELIAIARDNPLQLYFNRQQLLRISDSLTGEMLTRFHHLFSRSTETLRAMLEKEEYQIGHIGSRLLPLDRYPIVEVQRTDADIIYIIPNLRISLKSPIYAIDYGLLEALGDEYARARGFLQELYLQEFIENKLPDTLVIPERPYGKEERRGPDLTLIERSTQRIILVESKATRMRVGSRSTMSREILDDNLIPAYQALSKLPDKIQALYKGLPEYSDVQEPINSTVGSQPLCVVVLSETVYFMSELVRQEALADSNHRLHNFGYPFFILGVESFEKAVETAAITGKPLSKLLEEHWEESGAMNPATPSSDEFGKIKIDPRQTFAAQFLE